MDQTSIQLRAAIAGDEQGLEWIVGHFGALLQHQVRLRLGGSRANEADVEDVLADVWVAVFPKLGVLEPRDGHLAPVLAKYLATTALYKANNHLRGRIRSLGVSLDAAPDADGSGARGLDDLQASTRNALTRLGQNEVHGLVDEALKRMSETRRQVLVLRLMEQRTNQEVAALLELKPNTAAVHYKRGIAELRERLPASIYDEIASLGASPAGD